MDEYALITYNEVSILLEMGTENSFFPEANLIRPLPALPHYVEGITNLDGNISVAVDLAKFLGLTYTKDVRDLVFLQVRHTRGDFVVKIPLPKIINEQIEFKAIGLKDNFTMNIPSARYYAVGNQTYLVIVIDDFIEFLARELADILSSDWNQKAPTWSNEVLNNSVANQRSENLGSVKRTEIMTSSMVTAENIISFEIGSNHFLIEEKYINDIILDEFVVTELPNSVGWIRGIVNYQNESLIAIDFPNYLGIKADEAPDIDLVCDGHEAGFVLNASQVRTIPIDDLKPVFKDDLNDVSIPYSNIYIDELNSAYYKLNIPSIENSLVTMSLPGGQWNEWKTFLSKDKHIYENTDRYLMGELQSLNTLSAYIGKHQIIIPHDMIAILQSDSPYKYFDGFRFTQHGDKWIPSIDLARLYGEESQNNDYGTIVKYNDQFLELRSESAAMNYREVKILDEEKMEHIAPTSRAMGIKSLNTTRTGYAFDLDFEQLNEVVMQIKNKEGRELQAVMKDINQKFKIHQVQDEEISDLITGMWDKNSVLFLFAELADNRRFAYSTDNIKNFLYEVDENDDVVPWNYETRSDLFYYVQVSINEGEDKTYQIPSTSYLRAVSQDNIKKDNEGDFISLKKERIPILSFQ